MKKLLIAAFIFFVAFVFSLQMVWAAKAAALPTKNEPSSAPVTTEGSGGTSGFTPEDKADFAHPEPPIAPPNAQPDSPPPAGFGPTSLPPGASANDPLQKFFSMRNVVVYIIAPIGVLALILAGALYFLEARSKK